jgi:hypothetical protein
MMLVFSLAGAAAAATVLVAGAAWRVLARRDHRCVVVSRPSACTICAAVVDGVADRAPAGGHVVCACGTASPHLLGPELLRWRADHQGVPWPALGPEGASRVPDAAPDGPDADGDGLDDGLDAGLDAELEELGKDARRRIAEARRHPDPRTPRVMREAETGDVNPTPRPGSRG